MILTELRERNINYNDFMTNDIMKSDLSLLVRIPLIPDVHKYVDRIRTERELKVLQLPLINNRNEFLVTKWIACCYLIETFNSFNRISMF